MSGRSFRRKMQRVLSDPDLGFTALVGFILTVGIIIVIILTFIGPPV